MSEFNVRPTMRFRLFCCHKITAFTLVEALLALCIMVIGLVPLLHLLFVSILMADSAGRLSQATLIANAKLAEVVGKGYLEKGTDSGSIENEGDDTIFNWRTTVTDTPIRQLEDIGLSGVRSVKVAVTWSEGRAQKQISLSTYVCSDQIVTRTTLEGKGRP